MMFDGMYREFKNLFVPKKKESWKRDKGRRGRGATSSIIRTSHVASRRYQNITPGMRTRT